MINDTLKQAKEALQKAIDQKKLNQEFMNSLGPAVVELLKPTLEEMVANSKITKQELLDAVAGININVPATNVPEARVNVEIPEIKVPQPIVNVTVPDIKIPEFKEIKLPVIKVPKPEVTVNFDASRIKIPDIKMPEEMEVRGWINLMGFDKGLLRNPLPVQIRDAEGNPVSFGGGSAVIGGGGGKQDYFTIKGFMQSAFSEITNSDGEVKVAGTFTAGAAASSFVVLGNREDLPYNSDNPLPITGNISTSPAPQVSGYADSVNVIQSITLDVKQLSGSTDSVYVTGVAASVYAEIMNPDGRVKVELPTGSSGLTDTELRATAVPVSQLSGASWSVFASLDTTVALYNADNRLRVSVETGGSGLTDAELRASAIDVKQVSGSSDSVNVVSTVGLTNTELRATSVPVEQVSGSLWSVFATGAGASFFAEISNPDGRVKVELPTGSSGLTDTELRASHLDVQQVSGAIDSVNVVTTVGLTDTQLRASSLDVKQVSGSIDSVSVTNTVTVTGALTSAVAVGPTVADAVDDGSAPLQIGGVARTALPTAVANGDVVKGTFDVLGRQVVRNVNMRGLIDTAYASVANGTETTLLAGGGAGIYHDLIFIQFSNNSTSAVGVDLRSVTGGNIEQHYEIPANGVVGGALPVPWPQSSANNNWTIDLPDVTGTTVTASALFSNEV